MVLLCLVGVNLESQQRDLGGQPKLQLIAYQNRFNRNLINCTNLSFLN